jgi:hypothetical protein
MKPLTSLIPLAIATFLSLLHLTQAFAVPAGNLTPGLPVTDLPPQITSATSPVPAPAPKPNPSTLPPAPIGALPRNDGINHAADYHTSADDHTNVDRPRQERPAEQLPKLSQEPMPLTNTPEAKEESAASELA